MSKQEMPEYIAWRGMRNRCNCKSAGSYARYGGRGIKICLRWESFENFFADMGPRPSPNHSLDRINNDDHYYKENCRWATQSEQSLNQRRVPPSGVSGVHSKRKGWHAVYSREGREVSLYFGEDFFEAVCARRSWENATQRSAQPLRVSAPHANILVPA